MTLSPVDKSSYHQRVTLLSDEEKNRVPLFQLTSIKEIFFWLTFYLDNQSILNFSRTCKTVRKSMVSKQIFKKAAWSIARGVSFDLMTDIESQERLYKRINIRFPTLIQAFGTLQSLEIIPCTTLRVPVEHHAFTPFDSKIHRGVDSQDQVFLTFRLMIKNPFRLTYTEQIEVIYQTGNCWRRVNNGCLPHLTLGIQNLNDPAVSDIFISRLKVLLAGSAIGLAEPRSIQDPLAKKVPYQANEIKGPFSSYATL